MRFIEKIPRYEVNSVSKEEYEEFKAIGEAVNTEILNLIEAVEAENQLDLCKEAIEEMRSQVFDPTGILDNLKIDVNDGVSAEIDITYRKKRK